MTELSDTKRILEALAGRRGRPFNFEAVFSDESSGYAEPSQPALGSEVRLRIRTGAEKGISCKLMVHGQGHSMDMTVIAEEGGFLWHEARIALYARELSYCFRIEYGQDSFFYNRRGISSWPDEGYNFKIIADYILPGWAAETVYYQIFADRFANGDKTNDPAINEYAYLGQSAKRMEWGAHVRENDTCCFYGGDIQGMIDKLGYLKELGINCIYLNPIFVSPSSHKYDIQDYDHIDPHLGKIVKDGGACLSFESFDNSLASKYAVRTTDPANLKASDELFAEFVEKAHAKGIRVMLDGVFNHCGAFNKWMDHEGFYASQGYPSGAYTDQNSRYKGYFSWHGGLWPNNENYDGWWGHKNHPKLFYENSKELYDYIMEVAAKWVSPPYNCDGWRLDVAADIGMTREFNHKFHRDFRAAVRKANPDAIVLCEHYGSPAEWLNGREWDTIMNYDAFMEPVTWFFTGMEKHSEEYRHDLLNSAISFEGAMRRHMSDMPIQAQETAMNALSNHDHSRFLTRTNRTVGRLHTKGPEAAEQGISINSFISAVVLQMTWRGCPTVYYGDEAGLCGWTDPDDRRTFPWGHENAEILKAHKELISIRKSYPALIRGSLAFIYSDHGAVCYGRFIEFSKEARLIVAINNLNHSKNLKIPVWKVNFSGNSAKTVYASWRCADIITIEHGFAEIEMPPESSIIISSVQ